jgi:hypothetical protein
MIVENTNKWRLRQFCGDFKVFARRASRRCLTHVFPIDLFALHLLYLALVSSARGSGRNRLAGLERGWPGVKIHESENSHESPKLQLRLQSSIIQKQPQYDMLELLAASC